jgi:hypothetical protein
MPVGATPVLPAKRSSQFAHFTGRRSLLFIRAKVQPQHPPHSLLKSFSKTVSGGEKEITANGYCCFNTLYTSFCKGSISLDQPF